jgi:hypothetical protein
MRGKPHVNQQGLKRIKKFSSVHSHWPFEKDANDKTFDKQN